MRKALNENPVVQAAAIGVLALVVALMLLMRMGGGGSDAATEAPTAGDVAAPPVEAAPAVPATTDPAASAAPNTDSAAGTTVAPSGADFKAGPGLPAEIVKAYEGGEAVALLIVTDRGIDDRDLRSTVESVGSRSDVAVFVTDVKQVADYSRITEGVDVNRTPALIVIRPKSLGAGPMPTATIAYGFRGAGSVQQAFEDALYKGPSQLPYHP